MQQWLKRLFGVPRRPSALPDPVEPMPIANLPGFQVNFLSGSTTPLQREGLRFHAQLYLWTPLSVLRYHGRFAADYEAAASEEIPAEFGTWVKEPAAPAGWEPLELEEESDIGPVKPSVILPFLKAFRTIAESDLEPSVQAQRFNRMHLLNPAWKPFVAALRRPSAFHPEGAPDLASVWFCPHLEAGLTGIGPTHAAALYQAEFLTVHQVRDAKDAELLKIPGVNKGMLKRMRQG